MKLLIKENVITDLRSKGIINLNDAKSALLSYMSDVNLQDCILVPFSPKSYMSAKNSNNMIIGIKSDAVIRGNYSNNYQSKTGPAVVGIYGHYNFYAVANIDSIRANFAACDTFYEVIPANSDSITSRSKKHSELNRYTKYDDMYINDEGDVRGAYNAWSNKRDAGTHKIRSMSQDDMEMYDPNINRARYAKILVKNRLGKYVERYNELCKNFNEIRKLTSELSTDVIINHRSNYKTLTDAMHSYLYDISALDNDIKRVDKQDVDGYHRYSDTYESDLKNSFDRAEKSYTKVMQQLDILKGFSE